MNKDSQFIDAAIRLAERNSRSGKNGPFGALVVKGGRILGKGWNRVVGRHDPTAHAEIVAIRQAARRIRSHVLAGCTIYCSGEPCPMCLSAIYWARIERVVFACTRRDAADAGFDDDRIYRELARPPGRRKLAFVQRRRKKALRVLKKWKNNPGKIPY